MGSARPRTEPGAGLGDDARDDRMVLIVVSFQVYVHIMVRHGRDDEVSVIRLVADVKPICNFDGGKLRSSRACSTITTRMIIYTDDDGEGCDGADNDDDKSVDDDDDAVHIDMVLTKTRTFLQSKFVARRRYTPES